MTYALGARSRAQLAGVHPRLVAVVERAIALTAQDFAVFEGLRPPERQAEYLRTGVTRTRNSRHLRQRDGLGHAVDLVPWIAGSLRWEWPAIYPIAAAMRAAAVELGAQLTWGGVWDRRLADLPDTPAEIRKAVTAYAARHPGPDFLDGPHFQLEL